uniref:TROVE domain-containing protein n=1 Tax=viral metagenome TaxID=1070528 RepID=A0A6C0HS88_9ZZZZ
MEGFVKAFDNFVPPSTRGEKGHSQYAWAKPEETPLFAKKEKQSFSYFEEHITQISFQLVRGANIKKYEEVMLLLKDHVETWPDEGYQKYLFILFRMCAHTRDIVNGKGECLLAYQMLMVINKIYPKIGGIIFNAFFILEIDGSSVHPYGSWKDIKRLSELYKTTLKIRPEEVGTKLKFVIQLVNKNLANDERKLLEGNQVSLLGKWIPRENSAQGWLFEPLALDYYSSILPNPITAKSINYCKMKYRKLLSALNKKLDTTQVKQCSNTWASIEPNNVTSVTMFKNKKAFLNLTKKGTERSSTFDRTKCAENFAVFLDKATKGEATVKGKRIGLNDFTKQALELCDTKNYRETQMLNLQWKDNSTQNGNLEYMVPLVDVSGSMSGDPLNAAIGLGIRVAEKSRLGKRLITFSEVPEWVNLEGIDGFVDMVKKTRSAKWGMTTSFHKALELILSVIVQQKMSAEQVKQISLVIFSDMMIDAADKNYGSMFEMIKEKYKVVGENLIGVPYDVPHILFWNLRSTNGFPNLAKQKNTTMISGFSPLLLNLFCEKGVDGLENYTPWSMLEESLQHPRYDIINEL